jgi:hypothetical protein
MEVFHSDRPAKRFVAVLDGRAFYFGSPTGFTFIDGASEKTRDNYRRRHYANPVERFRIDNLVPSPALFSWYLLWNTPDLDENIRILDAALSPTPPLAPKPL